MDKARIDNIFTKGRCIQIPFFQRSYVCDVENWERFLKDMGNVCENILLVWKRANEQI